MFHLNFLYFTIFYRNLHIYCLVQQMNKIEIYSNINLHYIAYNCKLLVIDNFNNSIIIKLSNTIVSESNDHGPHMMNIQTICEKNFVYKFPT